MTDFSALYRNHSADVFRFALYVSGNRADAEDITAETFARVWMSPSPLRIVTVRAYLFTIARNLFLQGLRRRRREAPLEDRWQDAAPGADVRVEHKDELRRILAALRQLPEAERSALAMRAFHDMPYDEIAQALGIPVATAKVKVHRARRALMTTNSTQEPRR